jgi:hypothetical protein
MLPQFIHLTATNDSHEVLINVSSISRIEVRYYVPPEEGKTGPAWNTSVSSAQENPAAMRVYKLFVGEKEILLPANPNSGAMRLIEEIYKNAIKT